MERDIPEKARYSPAQHFLFLKSTFGLLLVGLFVAAGLMAWLTMVRENNPDLAIPQAVITTEWAGAAPNQIEKQITQEIEKKVKGLNGLKQVESGSFDSFSVVTVEFQADQDILESMINLRAKVDEAQAEFPSAAKKPTIDQVSVNDSPVISYMLYGNLHEELLQEAAKDLQKRLERVSGVRKVTIVGEREQTVYVRLHPERLRSFGISPKTVQDRINSANLDASWGAFEADAVNVQLRFEARFDNLEQLRALDIKKISADRIVRLGELAEVEMRPAKADVLTSFSTRQSEYEKGVGIQVQKIAGGDTIAIIDAVRASVDAARNEPLWIHGLEAEVTSNQADLINASFNDIFNNVWQAMLAVFVVLLFLLTWREATIAGLAIPLTLLASLGVLMGFGYTLNSMIIIGMVLALGMLVDVFILVMEGMHEGLYNRKLNFAESAIRTVKTFAKPALAGQMTTILALIPLLAIGGVEGKFIRLIPVTIIICLVASFAIAFLVCIPLSKGLLKSSGGGEELFVDRLFANLGVKLHRWLIDVPLAGKKTAALWLGGSAGLLFLVLSSVGLLPVEMYPKADGRNLGINIELGPNATLAQSEEIGDKAKTYLQSLSYMDNVTMYVGQKNPFSTGTLKESLLPAKSPNYVGFSAVFLEKSEREFLTYVYLDDLRAGLEETLAGYPGLNILFTPDFGGSSTDSPIQIVLKGEDVVALAAVSRQVQDLLSGTRGTTDVRDNIGAFRFQLSFTPITEALNFYGLTEDEVASQLRLSTEFDEIGKFKQPGVQDDLPIRLGAYWASRGQEIGGPRSQDELANLQIVTPDGQLIPLGSVVDFNLSEQPQVYVHTDGERAVTVKAGAEGRTASEILADITPALEEMKVSWPQGYDYAYGGEAQSSGETFGDMGAAFVLALLMVFAVLTLIFGNFGQPVIVLVSVPMAMIGTFGGFYLTGTSLSFPGIIGLVTLVGIVVNNAIVMVETINGHKSDGLSPKEAAARSAAERLRPILGTTITTVVGLIPLALSAPMWYPLSMAIVYGLLFSTLVSLILVPALYYLITPEPVAEEAAVAA